MTLKITRPYDNTLGVHFFSSPRVFFCGGVVYSVTLVLDPRLIYVVGSKSSRGNIVFPGAVNVRVCGIFRGDLVWNTVQRDTARVHPPLEGAKSTIRHAKHEFAPPCV